MHSHNSHNSEVSVSTLLKYRNQLFHFIQKRVGDFDLAEDIFQDSLLKAIHRAPDIGEEERLLSWFYSVLRNTIIDTYRKNNTDKRKLDSIMNSFSLQSSENEEAELCACFNELLPSMKPEYRDLIEKLDLGGESLEFASERLQTNKNNVKVQRHRARQQLKKFIEESCRACATHGCLDCTCNG